MQVGVARYEIVGTGSKRRHRQASSFFYYVPLFETLKSLLINPGVVHEIENPRPPSNLLRDFCDGDRFKSHPLFRNDNNALQIVAYYDELEICNPLGAAAKVHKLGLVFMFLANINPRFRSTLRMTQLVAVATSKVIKEHGIDEILKPFIADVKRLGVDGIDITVNGVCKNYKGALLAFLADNLASHSVGGFKESMSFAFRFCRRCMATRITSNSSFSDQHFELRTPTAYDMQCKQLQGPLKEHYSKIYGINRRAKLEDIPHFSVTTCLPFDIMHDLFEGAVLYEIKALLKHCIVNKYFTLDELNSRIHAFDYGYSEMNNKPIALEVGVTRDEVKFRQTASSSWLLARVLPLLIGDIIPLGDEAWHCYQLLLKIVDICTAQYCNVDSIAHLHTLIEEHHFLFKATYELPLLPKQHFMVHYPRQILQMGPLIHSWNMRHESKLRLCKQASEHGNFKNICYSVSMKHQRWMCLQLQAHSFLELPPENGGKSSTCLLSDESSCFVECYKLFDPSSLDSTIITHYTWVKFHHFIYKKGGVVLINDSPCFGKITDVFYVSTNTEPLLCIDVYKARCFDEHYHAFCLANVHKNLIVPVSKLLLPNVLHFYKNFEHNSSNIFVVLKYGLCC